LKPVAFKYDAAASVSDGCRALGEGADAKVIAGGQSLGPMLNLRLVRPGSLLDVSTLPEIREAHETEAGVVIGAAITHAEIEDGAVPDSTGGWLGAAAANIAHRGVRNRGTIGGSLAHADPAADWVIVMTGLDASVTLEGPSGRRELPMSDFVVGPFETALSPDEILVSVFVPKPNKGARWGYWKYMRQVGEFAKASATVLIDPQSGLSRIALGALGQQPLILPSDVAEQVIAERIEVREALYDAFNAAGLPTAPENLALHVTAVHRALAIARADDHQPSPESAS
jgi:carbon-monoxide dehydrogenase medium subunit